MRPGAVAGCRCRRPRRTRPARPARAADAVVSAAESGAAHRLAAPQRPSAELARRPGPEPGGAAIGSGRAAPAPVEVTPSEPTGDGDPRAASRPTACRPRPPLTAPSCPAVRHRRTPAVAGGARGGQGQAPVHLDPAQPERPGRRAPRRHAAAGHGQRRGTGQLRPRRQRGRPAGGDRRRARRRLQDRDDGRSGRRGRRPPRRPTTAPGVGGHWPVRHRPAHQRSPPAAEPRSGEHRSDAATPARRATRPGRRSGRPGQTADDADRPGRTRRRGQPGRQRPRRADTSRTRELLARHLGAEIIAEEEHGA